MGQAKVLMIDDDPQHLAIYGLVLGSGGFEHVLCLAIFSGITLPDDADIKLVVLDYTLHTAITPPEVAHQIQAKYRGVPILLLSDVFGLPTDIAPFVAGFVRKGEPEKLLAAVGRLMKAQ